MTTEELHFSIPEKVLKRIRLILGEKNVQYYNVPDRNTDDIGQTVLGMELSLLLTF